MEISVSIITPCYNGARFLADTLRSALAQSFRPVEIIVIDDGSTDDSAAIAESFGPPVRVIRQTNHGESVARNRGIAEAIGTHLLFLDADDLVAPEALERLTAALRHDSRAVALMGCARFTADPAVPESVLHASAPNFFPTLIETNFGPPHTWLAPAAVVREAGGFYEPLRWSEDWDILWRIGLYASKVVCVAYTGALYRLHPQSQFATMGVANRRRGHAAIMARMIPVFFERRDLLEQHGEALFWGGWTALHRAREARVPWNELKPLCVGLKRLAADGPSSVTKTKIALTTRAIGLRLALRLQSRTESPA